jgi:formylglycine-generating enzyme
MRVRSARWAGLIAVLGACGGSTGEPLPQWVVVLSTDAGVPQFGDMVYVEVIDGSGALACSECRRQLPAGQAERWPMSFGITADGRQSLRVRARLYRSYDTGSDGLPRKESILDAIGKLPAADAGVRTVSLRLMMSCFDVPAEPGAGLACDPATGQSAPERVLEDVVDMAAVTRSGTWEPARPRGCQGAVPDGMVCVEGGVFLIGSPLGFPGSLEWRPLPEHLVRVGAMAMDVDELTVGQMRKLVREQGMMAPQQRFDDEKRSWCTWLGEDDASNDAMPVNCITREHAESVCELLGKRLPTEAEWEWAAGNKERETPFPWGFEGEEQSSEVCGRAVIARAVSMVQGDGAFECRVSIGGEVPPGPQAGGLASDQSALGLRNLAGNVAEWVADTFASYDDDCWKAESKLLVDPKCEGDPTLAYGASERGGSWWAHPYQAKVFERSAGPQNSWSANTGFRCVKGM